MEDQTMADTQSTTEVTGEFTQEQVRAISDIVVKAVNTAVNARVSTANTPDNVEKLDKDPAMEQADKVEGELLAQLVNPKYMMVRGRKGARLINVTQKGIESLANWRKERGQYGSETFIK
jgi:hypothetical protein